MARSGAPTRSPAPGQTIARLRLLTAGAGTHPWCAGHAFRVADVPAGAALAGLQMTVKSKWPDGSVKVAVLAGTVAAAGASTEVALRIGAPAAGRPLTLADLKATGVTASVGASPYGTASWSEADWDTPFLVWAQGPVMSSWIYRRPVGSDAHLTAWLEVRLFSGGEVEVVPWIENGYLLRAGPSAKPGTYSFSLGGTPRFGPTPLPVHHHTRAPLLSGAALGYWLGADRTVLPKHSNTYLYGTGLTQCYMKVVERNFGNITGGRGVSMQFTPYEAFSPTVTIHSTVMGQGGGHPSIGVQPAWEAIALVDNSAQGYTQLLRECYRMGQWQIHYRDELTHRPVNFRTRAGVQLRVGEADTVVNVYNRQDGGLTPTPAIVGGNDAGSTGKFVNSHQPAAPLLAYLMSGRYWFMEECQHIAGINFLSQPASRKGSALHTIEPCITPSLLQLRGAAWTLRNLLIAECATPDDDPLRPGYTASVDANIGYYHGRYIAPFGAGGMNPLGVIQTLGVGTYDGNQAWQYDFWTGAWGRAIAFRCGSTRATREKARAFFDWVSRSVVGRLGGTGPSEYLYRFATTASNRTPGVYRSRLFAGSTPGRFTLDATGAVTSDYNDGKTPDYKTGSGPWLADWGAFYEKRIVVDEGYTGGKVDGPLMGPDALETDGWWAMLHEAITVCAALGAPGAVAALGRLRANSVWSTYVTSGSIYTTAYPVNAVDYVTLPTEDFKGFLPREGMRQNVNLNSADSVDFDRAHGGTLAQRWWTGYGGGNSFASMTFSYSGAVWAPEYGTAGALVANGGGHGAFIGAFVYLFDFGTLTWKQVGAPKNLPPNLEWAGYAAPPSAVRTESLEKRDPRWLDYPHGGSYIKFSDHSYLQNAYVSPSEGGGRNGALLLPQATFSQDPGVADPRTGTAYRWAPHLFSLSDGTMSRATTEPLGGWAAYSNTIAVKDTQRSRIWYFRHGSITADCHDLQGGPPYTRKTHVVQKAGGGNTDTYFGTYNSTWVYVPEADAIVSFTPDNSGYTPTLNAPIGVGVLGLSTGVPVDFRRSDIPRHPMRHSGIFVGVAWCPTLQRFYLYQGMGDDFCIVLTPSSLDFARCDWTWSKESFGGPPPVTRFPGEELTDQIKGVLGRWVWVPAHGCFAWHDGPTTTGVCADGVKRNGIVQLWRPPGVRVA